jgi:transcriptional regulator of acetoin/glycerol metabolism
LEYAVAFADDFRIFPWNLPDYMVESAGERDENPQEDLISPFENERTKIVQALENSRYNLTKAAKQLGISRGTLYKKMEKYQIT